MKVVKRILIAIGCILLAVVLFVGGFIGYLSITEYKPEQVESVEIAGDAKKTIKTGETIKLLSWNIGYGALGDNADFFMDGGSSVKTATTERVFDNLTGIAMTIKREKPDILLLQEADRDSARSSHYDEIDILTTQAIGRLYDSSFANNFKVAFLPYPIPPIGKVDSGLASFSAYDVESAERIQLPIPFAWPIRMANLKRCLLVQRIDLDGSDKQLVVINLHLEAYDDGEGKVMQTKMLKDYLNEEREAGNYVIAAGDFNQVFSDVENKYPINPGKWEAGEINVAEFGEGWQFLMDDDVPSCRSLDRPYVGEDHEKFQYYIIDGMIVSDNIEVKSFSVRDLGFIHSDHNPVAAELILK